MIRSALTALAALAAFQTPIWAQRAPGSEPEQDASEGSCASDVDAMMALSPAAFDQDLTGGWRRCQNRKCQRPMLSTHGR